MESCVFSYYLSDIEVEIEELPIKHRFGRYFLATDSKTPYQSSFNENCECAIFGVAVNVITGDCENLTKNIIEKCSNIDDVIAFEKELGGKYIIFYREKNFYYILGDATCSIPAFFNIDSDCACTSNFQYILDCHDYLPDKEFSSIRNNGDISQAMPYDITQYREIKQLLPNHYLDVNKSVAIRFMNAQHSQPILTVEQATKVVAPMVETVSAFYSSMFPVYCPITAGRDSRVVLAFLADQNAAVHCYTIQHPEHSGNEQDMVIPQQLCEKYQFSYERIKDVLIPDALKKKMNQVLGENNYSLRTLRIAETIKEHYGDGAVINGDIIGQVGKCSLHRDIPLCFATAGYFRCKLHNYSHNAKKQLKRWLREIRDSGEGVNAFDLFSIENRMGRWAGQENLIYNSIGQVYLNIFNSRSIIYTWTAVKREERKKSLLHISLIKEKYPQLLSIPFETDESVLVKLSKATGELYLLSSYAKYYIEKLKFRREK